MQTSKIKSARRRVSVRLPAVCHKSVFYRNC